MSKLEKLNKMAQNAQDYKNNEEITKFIRSATDEIEKYERQMVDLKQQIKDIHEAVKAKGIDLPTFKYLMEQKQVNKEVHENELEILEELKESSDKIYKNKNKQE